MDQFLLFASLGLSTGAVYAVLASSLVAVYAATGIINFAQGAVALWSVWVVAALRTDGVLVLPVGSIALTPGGPLQMWPAILIGVGYAVVWCLLAHLLVFRPLRRAPILSQVVASVGLMVFLQALVTLRFDTVNTFVRPVLSDATVDVGGALISVSNLVLAAVAGGVALAMWAWFRFTRAGVATRAGAEDERAARLTGFAPDRLAAAVWAMTGAATALVTVLAAPTIGLDPVSYTFYVIPALAAALLGRLTSIGVACVAGLGLGSFQTVLLWLTSKSWWPDWAQAGFGDAVPFVVVIVALFVLGGKIPSRGSLGEVRMPAVTAPRLRPVPVAVTIAAAVAAVLLTSGTWRFGVVTSAIMALIALSLVLLTGYLGQISLASMAFAGAAGFALSKVTTDLGVPFPFSILISALAATFLGVLVGIPALRIRGAQLAVVTLAAAIAIQSFVFSNPAFTPFEGNLIEDPSLFGIDLSVRSGTTLTTVPFSLMVIAVVATSMIVVARLMAGASGRAFLAVRSNERAAASAGIDVAATKLLGFALSAFLAGVGGCLIGYSRSQLSVASFSVLIGLSLLAMTYVGGITHISGAIIAGLIAPLGVLYTFLNQTVDLGHYYHLIAALGLLVTAVLNPAGIAGTVHHAYAAARGRHGPPGHEPPTPAAPVAEPRVTTPDAAPALRGTR
ncbi:ABC transporter permease [Nocardioides pacificus]